VGVFVTLTIRAQEPSARDLNSSVWTGSELIVWGGRNSGGVFNDGARFNPTTGLWVPVSTNGAPSPRFNHSAVWAGDRMIVFGGQDDSGTSLASGAVYHPASDTWSPLPTANAPTRRHQTALLWTGNELIVWGGAQLFSGFPARLATGARLPVGQTNWVPTNLTNVPDARVSLKSVWTGSEMIVWGDQAKTPFNSFENVSTGGRYDPASDTWTPTSTNLAPAARNQHSAVWTGTEFIVWGGNSSNSTAPLASGGRYSPSNDAWLPTTTNAAPSPRRSHSAIWDGTRMIVWGGESGTGSGAALGDGSAYDPTTDSWQPIPTPNQFGARYNHSAVWTGYEMLIWGGTGSGGIYFSNLVRYVPSAGVWNARPGVQLTAPANGTQLILPPLVTLNATALDTDGTVTNVAFFANDLPLGNATAAPYSFAWNSPPPGNYALTAVASDNSGLMTTSAVAQLIIALPNQAPTVTITSPGNAAQVVANGTLTLDAAPVDTDGFIASVEFRDGLSVIGTRNVPPWTLAWNNIALGPHALTAVATDNLGLSATSAVVNLEAVMVPQLELFRDSAAWRLELTGGETGRVYRLERTTNFLDWTPWQTNLATNGSFTTTDPDLNGPRRFYRAVP
jgi:N-acetylneuraminic acid mutarotase